MLRRTVTIIAASLSWPAIAGASAPAPGAARAQPAYLQDTPLISPALQKILDDASRDPKYDYPTSLTRDIVPKSMHSHNDYWRPVPFYSALAAGAVSVEADVWLYPDADPDALFVGHEPAALTRDRTLDSLYVQPLLRVLRAQNPNNTLTGFASGATTTKNGVYDASPGQTLYLFVDVKTDGQTTWPAVVRALQPLRDAGYLTAVAGTGSEVDVDVVPGPVTVVGTGNTPRGAVQGVAHRDYFWDAPVAGLANTNLTAAESPVASGDFAAVFGSVRGNGNGNGTGTGPGTVLDAAQLGVLRAQVEEAHGRGIMVRYWGQPGWPVGTRNAVWRALWDEGVDLLSVDDLEGAAGFWEGSG